MIARIDKLTRLRGTLMNCLRWAEDTGSIPFGSTVLTYSREGHYTCPFGKEGYSSGCAEMSNIGPSDLVHDGYTTNGRRLLVLSVKYESLCCITANV